MKNFEKILIIFIIFFSFSCKDDDENTENAENIRDWINNIGHLEEPEDYPPEQIGEPNVLEENVNGVVYEKTETNYKFAKKFETKTQVSFSKKKNFFASNDIFLGAIIQGKYWSNDGDLISIGSFSRNKMTITLNGADIEGSNSIDVSDPSNANMTDAINTLTSNNFVAGTLNYDSKIEVAHSKNQIGLSLGMRPSWLENIGFDFNNENSQETNTVFVYFKQIYYSISAELPAQVSDFFSDDLDAATLKTKINTESPAGYISSIDYGRVVIVKMTSSSSKIEMKAAIEAVFEGLNVGIGGEYSSTIGNSDFKAQIYGGNSSTVITNIEETIALINDGLTITNLQNAVPIEYHINYLDGGNFNTGEVVEYKETNYKIKNANSMKIKKLIVHELPDGNWDKGEADVFFKIFENEDIVFENPDNKIENVTNTMLENGEVLWDINYTISDFDKNYKIGFFDHDTFDNDEMGTINFTVNSDIINSGTSLNNVFLESSNIKIELIIEWQ